jgi:CheY-like chemotaxis protein
MDRPILIVDDDEEVRESLRGVLSLEGHQVEVCGSGHEAIRLLEKEGTRPCIVLLDLKMPDGDGYEVLRALRQSPVTRDAPIAVMTGSEGGVPPDIPVLLKPFEVDHLMEIIRAHCCSDDPSEVQTQAP